jgi:hypothetical protein
MKKIVRLTENDLARIVKRVIRESEESSQEQGKCVDRIKLSDAANRARKACGSSSLGRIIDTTIDYTSCIKVGDKSKYPKTYEKLKGLNFDDYPMGCVDLSGNALNFYEDYTGWLNLVGKNCGEKITIIKEAPQSVIGWVNKNSDDCSWYVDNNAIYLVSFGGGC